MTIKRQREKNSNLPILTWLGGKTIFSRVRRDGAILLRVNRGAWWLLLGKFQSKRERLPIFRAFRAPNRTAGGSPDVGGRCRVGRQLLCW
jgi:hypothetical protein